MNNYWKDRFIELEKSSYKKGYQAYKNIEESLIKAQREIEKQIEAWYGRFAVNNSLDIHDAKLLLNSKELEEFKWDVKQYIAAGRENAINLRWMKELENASAKFHVTRLQALKLRLQQEVELVFGNQVDKLDKTLRDVFAENYYQTIFEVQKGFNVGFPIDRVDETLLDKLISKPWARDGKNFSARIWGNRDKLVNELQNELIQNVFLGRPPKKLIERFANKFNTQKSNAARLVMTEVAFFHTVSQKKAFEELNIKQYEVVAVLDSKTSPICQDFDGQVFSLKDMEIGVNAPPFHPRCRSIIVPYYDDYGVGERVATDRDGNTIYIPSNMRYKDWKRQYIDGTDLEKNEIEYRVLNNQEINDYQKLSNKWYNRLSDAEADVIKDYSENGYEDINEALGKGSVSEEEIANKISLIDSALDKFELLDDVIVYKGTYRDYFENYEVGDVFDIKCFYSTSFDEGVAEDFSTFFGTDFMVEIKVPMGTVSAYLGYNGAYENENELLLARGLKYRVLKIEANRIFLEVVKDDK